MWHEEEPVVPATGRSKGVVVIVLTLVMLATLVLCCMGIAEAARLIDVDPTRL